MGFGHKEQESAPDFKGEELFGVTLELAFCERGAWFHCICGVPNPVARSQGSRGVCSGDSGGPVVYRGQLVNYFITNADIIFKSIDKLARV